MPERTTPDYAAEGIPSADPGVPSYALQALLGERQAPAHMEDSGVSEQHDETGGLANLHQFASHDLSHLNHFHAVGMRALRGQPVQDAVQGHLDLMTGMYRAPINSTLQEHEASRILHEHEFGKVAAAV